VLSHKMYFFFISKH